MLITSVTFINLNITDNTIGVNQFLIIFIISAPSMILSGSGLSLSGGQQQRFGQQDITQTKGENYRRLPIRMLQLIMSMVKGKKYFLENFQKLLHDQYLGPADFTCFQFLERRVGLFQPVLLYFGFYRYFGGQE